MLSQDFETAHWFELLFPFQKANTNHQESTVGMTKRLRRPDNKWRMCNCNNKRPAEANQPMCRGLQPAAASRPEPEFKKFFEAARSPDISEPGEIVKVVKLVSLVIVTVVIIGIQHYMQ